MKVCGIIAAKEKSTRFPGKNRLMYKENLHNMSIALGKENIFMLTDDQEIYDYCISNGYTVHWEPPALALSGNHVFCLKYMNAVIKKEYDIIVTILCNTVGHSAMKIREAARALQCDPEALEVKSFNHEGHQSGIFAFWADRLPEKRHRIAMIISNGKEIHYKEELDAYNE